METYWFSLFNLNKNHRRHLRKQKALRRESNYIEPSLSQIDIHNETVLRRVIQRISQGDYAHLPNIRDLKALFNNPRHQRLLQHTYKTLHLKQTSIDETSARVISAILLSRNCQCRHLILNRCAFTDSGRKILYSALSMMAEFLPKTEKKHRVGVDSDCIPVHMQGACGVASNDSGCCCCSRIVEDHAPAEEYAEESPEEELEKADIGTYLGLYTFELYQESLTDLKCAGLGQILAVQPHLQSLNLSSNLIGPNGARKLVAAISHSCPMLQILNISDNHLKAQGARIIAQYLVTTGRHLINLDISSNDIAQSGAEEIAYALSPQHSIALQYLNLDMNRIGVLGCRVLGRALAENKRLVSLALSRNNLFDEGCAFLFGELYQNTALRHLDISGNFITHVGARSISEYLSFVYGKTRLADGTMCNSTLHTGLVTLNISANSIQDAGMDLLCQGLSKNNHILHLIADTVDISDAGARNIGQLLSAHATKPTSLLTLSIRYNQNISAAGYEAISQSCQENTHILRVMADMHFENWSSVWKNMERAFVFNTLRAIDRQKVPLLTVARGRLLLRNNTNSLGILRLPMDIRLSILYSMDRFKVLSRKQQRRAVNAACDLKIAFNSKNEMLLYVLGEEYLYVHEMIKTINS